MAEKGVGPGKPFWISESLLHTSPLLLHGRYLALCIFVHDSSHYNFASYFRLSRKKNRRRRFVRKDSQTKSVGQTWNNDYSSTRNVGCSCRNEYSPKNYLERMLKREYFKMRQLEWSYYEQRLTHDSPRLVHDSQRFDEARGTKCIVRRAIWY